MASGVADDAATARLWASCFGAGFAPAAPGTAGSALAAVVYCAAALTLSSWDLSMFCAGACLLACAITLGDGNRVRLASEDADPQLVVSDEFAGMFLAYFILSLLPLGLSVPGATLAVFAFFRLFDVVKPFGIRKLEPLPGGWGVLMDDLAAALYATATLLLLLWALNLITSVS